MGMMNKYQVKYLQQKKISYKLQEIVSQQQKVLENTKGGLVNLLSVIEGIDTIAEDKTCRECKSMDKQINRIHNLVSEIDIDLAKEQSQAQT